MGLTRRASDPSDHYRGPERGNILILVAGNREQLALCGIDTSDAESQAWSNSLIRVSISRGISKIKS